MISEPNLVIITISSYKGFDLAALGIDFQRLLYELSILALETLRNFTQNRNL